MKLKTILIGLAGVVATTAQATLFEYDFENTNPDVAWTIPDGDPAGFSNSQVISGVDAPINNVSVTIHVSGGYNGDLYGYLVSDSGFAILLNRVGSTAGNPYGSSGSGLNVTFNDETGSDIHLASTAPGAVLTGTFASDGRNVDPAGALNTDARTATLSSFNGGSANGTWTLFLADVSPIGQSTLLSWSLDISVVPEPTTYALVGFGLLVAATGIVRRTLCPAKVKIRR